VFSDGSSRRLGLSEEIAARLSEEIEETSVESEA
jgi:hypothetical protein